MTDCYGLLLMGKKVISMGVQIRTSNNLSSKIYCESVIKMLWL